MTKGNSEGEHKAVVFLREMLGEEVCVSPQTMKLNRGLFVIAKENKAMMIFMLAAAMTVGMLIATAVGIHFEAQRIRMDDQNDRVSRF